MNVGIAFEDASRRLAAAGIAGARFEARVLVGNVLGMDAAAVMGYPETAIGSKKAQRLESFVVRRAKREPMAQILQVREFWSLPFHVTQDTLIPRPDSETIVEAALEGAKGQENITSILDLGTGSGCLLLALLHELPDARGIGVDTSAAALNVAKKNARTLRLEKRTRFVEGNWNTKLKTSFDLIVSNPPYIPERHIAGLEPEVSLFEPRLALSGGADGLDCYRAIAPLLKGLLTPRGRVFFEIGEGQTEQVAGILQKHDMQVLDIKNDLAGIPRCVSAVVAE